MFPLRTPAERSKGDIDAEPAFPDLRERPSKLLHLAGKSVIGGVRGDAEIAKFAGLAELQYLQGSPPIRRGSVGARGAAEIAAGPRAASSQDAAGGSYGTAIVEARLGRAAPRRPGLQE